MADSDYLSDQYEDDFVQEDESVTAESNSEDEVELKIAEEHQRFLKQQEDRRQQMAATRPWSAPPLSSPRPWSQQKHTEQKTVLAAQGLTADVLAAAARQEYTPPERPYLSKNSSDFLGYMAPPRPQSADARQPKRVSSYGVPVLHDIKEEDASQSEDSTLSPSINPGLPAPNAHAAPSNKRAEYDDAEEIADDDQESQHADAAGTASNSQSGSLFGHAVANSNPRHSSLTDPHAQEDEQAQEDELGYKEEFEDYETPDDRSTDSRVTANSSSRLQSHTTSVSMTDLTTAVLSAPIQPPSSKPIPTPKLNLSPQPSQNSSILSTSPSAHQPTPPANQRPESPTVRRARPLSAPPVCVTPSPPSSAPSTSPRQRSSYGGQSNTMPSPRQSTGNLVPWRPTSTTLSTFDEHRKSESQPSPPRRRSSSGTSAPSAAMPVSILQHPSPLAAPADTSALTDSFNQTASHIAPVGAASSNSDNHQAHTLKSAGSAPHQQPVGGFPASPPGFTNVHCIPASTYPSDISTRRPSTAPASAARRMRPASARPYLGRRPESFNPNSPSPYKPLSRPASANPYLSTVAESSRPATALSRHAAEAWAADAQDMSPAKGVSTAAVDVAGVPVSVYVADSMKRIVEANRWLQQLGLTKRYRLRSGTSSRNQMDVEVYDVASVAHLGPEDTWELSAAAVAPAVRQLTLKAFLNAHSRLRQQVQRRATDQLLNGFPASVGVSPPRQRPSSASTYSTSRPGSAYTARQPVSPRGIHQQVKTQSTPDPWSLGVYGHVSTASYSHLGPTDMHNSTNPGLVRPMTASRHGPSPLDSKVPQVVRIPTTMAIVSQHDPHALPSTALSTSPTVTTTTVSAATARTSVATNAAAPSATVHGATATTAPLTPPAARSDTQAITSTLESFTQHAQSASPTFLLSQLSIKSTSSHAHTSDKQHHHQAEKQPQQESRQSDLHKDSHAHQAAADDVMQQLLQASNMCNVAQHEIAELKAN